MKTGCGTLAGMRHAVALSALVAAVAGLTALSRRSPPESRQVVGKLVQTAPGVLVAPCPPGTLPDQGVCIPVPRPRAATRRDPERGVVKRPDRPADFARYVLPVARAASPSVVERNPAAGADPGSGGFAIWITAPPGTPVSAVALEGQAGPARVAFAGELEASTVVTLHDVKRGDRASTYVAITGNLEASSAPPLREPLAAGTPLGKVGASPVYFELRLLRPNVDALATPADRLRDEALTVPVDPRNLLELAP